MNEHGSPAEMAERLLSALRFAAEKHRAQRRKDTAATPYINHPIAVAETLVRVGNVGDPVSIQAAILHDTLEDTETTIAELDEQFGEDVRRLVEELTDDKGLPKAERKRRQVDHAPQLSQAAKALKLADKICNVSDLCSADPVNWPLDRKLEYLDWACQVVEGCRGSNPQLEERFDSVIEDRRGDLLSSKGGAKPHSK